MPCSARSTSSSPASRSWTRSTHDWLADEFARGTWAIHRPGWYTRHHAAMREPENGLVFAGSDLADGWSGFVDGAIESGLRAAHQVQALLLARLPEALNGCARGSRTASLRWQRLERSPAKPAAPRSSSDNDDAAPPPISLRSSGPPGCLERAERDADPTRRMPGVRMTAARRGAHPLADEAGGRAVGADAPAIVSPLSASPRGVARRGAGATSEWPRDSGSMPAEWRRCCGAVACGVPSSTGQALQPATGWQHEAPARPHARR